jgi:LPS sulfotransferase NodH
MSSETRVVPFLVLHLGRTGSTYLVEALDRHPEVQARYEAMARLRENARSAKEQLAEARTLLTGRSDRGPRAIGFKTKLQDVLDPEAFASIVRETGTRVIHLQRRNVVKLTVSVFNSERIHARTGEWNVYSEGDRIRDPLTIDPKRFMSMLSRVVQTRARVHEYVRSLERPTLTFYYEDLLLDPRETLRMAFAFLSVSPRDPVVRVLKSTSDDLRSVVANFDELRTLAGSEYEEMFDEILQWSSAGHGKLDAPLRE